jgi:nucleotide-binding universal stress UspA family protein
MSGSEPSHLRHRSSADTASGVIVVEVDGYPESRDAAALAATIAAVTRAEVMVVAVHPGAPVVLPQEMGWVAAHERTAEMVHELRDSVLPEAGTVIETDQTVGRALERVATLEHQDLLVVGSSRGTPLGRVRIDNRTRQLLGQAQCAVAIAPRGLSARDPQKLRVIGVAYDREPEAREALKLATSLARAADAKLRVEGVLQSKVESLREDAERAAAATGGNAEVPVTLGAPADRLRALSEAVDLLVIGSRRSGPADQVHLGSTAKTLLHDARCPIVVVPAVMQSSGSEAVPSETPT